jgi:hypothetical protein
VRLVELSGARKGECLKHKINEFEEAEEQKY